MTGADRRARELLDGAAGVLFDFDGPLCRLFPEGASAPLADEVRNLADKFGLGGVLDDSERVSIDPHVVLRAVHRARHEWDVTEPLALIEAAVTAGELAAARSAWPTPRADALVARLARRGARLAVVTNNAPGAAAAYLDGMGLLGRFDTVQGRTADPGLMKPHPDVLHRALRDLALAPADAVMVGDTGTDAAAARSAGVPFVGYGRDKHKVSGLRAAGADVVVTSYEPLVEPLSSR
ncbi:HAD-IA family hydrolase [Streptomyces sp. NPDC006997]|uniref:HAD family hydrolase n=1 Tax=Streptomyces sp. NPDC006997 TaxID=3155356 RepID=UPI0033C1875A